MIKRFFTSTLLSYGLIGIVLTGLVWLYYWFNPVEWYFPACTFHRATGFYCPLCGSQRAFHYLLHGNLGVALQHNLLLPLGIVALLYTLVLRWRQRVYEKFYYNYLEHPYAMRALVVFLILYWILRNLPYAPFMYLQPIASTN